MTTIYIYTADQYQSVIDNQLDKAELEILDQHTADTNEACENWAKENNYDESDLFAWSYTDLTK
jgi:hypothetical protein